MKKALHKIMALVMAFVVLFSTMSFTLNMHFCGNTLVATTVFKEAKTCGMDMAKQSTSSDCAVTKKDCCSNEQLVVSGQDDLQLVVNKITFNQQVFLAAFAQAYVLLLEDIKKEASSATHYPPPLIVKKIYQLDETYLI